MKKIFLYVILLSFLLFPRLIEAEFLSEKLAGRILLQVEHNGEAWYVSPDNLMRYFLGRPEDAFELMRDQGVGISNKDLEKIAVGLLADKNIDSDQDGLTNDLEMALGTDPGSIDTDKDGFSDKDEIKNGYNPQGSGVQAISWSFSKQHKGKIFLQVEHKGEAWYINPADAKRYFLGRPEDAFNIMRTLGLGITDENLEKILARTPNYSLKEIEQSIYRLINDERAMEGLSELIWNNDIALVARKHSRNLTKENSELTSFDTTCDYPLIHHEGLEYGPYSKDRLNLDNIYFFSKSGENIALMPGVAQKKVLNPSDEAKAKISECIDNRDKFDVKLTQDLDNEEDEDKKIERIKTEIEARRAKMTKEIQIELYSLTWDSQEDLARKTVDGWMNSPGHKKNILTHDYDETGVGADYINGYLIITQVFITRAECGFKYGNCCEKEGYYPYCFIPLECNNGVCL